MHLVQFENCNLEIYKKNYKILIKFLDFAFVKLCDLVLFFADLNIFYNHIKNYKN